MNQTWHSTRAKMFIYMHNGGCGLLSWFVFPSFGWGVFFSCFFCGGGGAGVSCLCLVLRLKLSSQHLFGGAYVLVRLWYLNKLLGTNLLYDVYK